MKKILSGLAAVALCGSVAACSAPADPEPRPTVTKTAPAKPAPETDEPAVPGTDISDDELTRSVFKLVWDDAPAEDRKAMCDGIDLMGDEWAKEMLKDGSGGDAAGVDWELTVKLMKEKCNAPGGV